jgi:cellulose synthase/poly-beta-1,6-N-acetylglucosamine synthase-like glycosyltransferase
MSAGCNNTGRRPNLYVKSSHTGDITNSQSWRAAESREEFIHDLTEGALHILENDYEFAGIFEGTEYKNLLDSYDRNDLYGNPLTDITHTSLKDKPVLKNTVEYLKQEDTLYAGVAKATKSGVKQMATKVDQSIGEFGPERLFQYMAGIARTIADHVEIKPWMSKTDAIFFNDPTYITSVD